MTAFLNEVMAANSWAAEEMIPLLWDALLASDEWGTKGDYIEKTFVRLITLWAPVFEALCEPPKCQMCLTIKIQQACYDDSRFLKYFSIILQQFFKHDVLSDAAIIYWYEKGALPVGKTLMQKQLEAFVAWLREQESDDEDEDED